MDIWSYVGRDNMYCDLRLVVIYDMSDSEMNHDIFASRLIDFDPEFEFAHFLSSLALECDLIIHLTLVTTSRDKR